MSRPEVAAVRAAGAVLWRDDTQGRTQVAMVHRPRYDDWSLPKGKLDGGETAPAAAAREVHEETGFRAALGRFLLRTSYALAAEENGTTRKEVDYFSARVLGGRFEPNREVDRLRWVPVSEAETVLSYPADIDVVRRFRALPAELTTLLLVRHAKAGKREDWTGDDDLRPLSEAGTRQTDALRALLPVFGPDRVFAAPRLRCVQTVSGAAEDLGVEVTYEEDLSEEGYWRDPARGLARLLAIAGSGGTPLVCSQGAVIPDVVRTLAERNGVELPAGTVGANAGTKPVASKKASVWLLSFLPAAPGPRLVAADYFASPMPAPAPARP